MNYFKVLNKKALNLADDQNKTVCMCVGSDFFLSRNVNKRRGN